MFEKLKNSRFLSHPLALVLSLSAVFFIIFLMVSGILFMRRSGVARTEPVAWKEGGKTALFSSGRSSGAVAVVELKGVIMDSKKVVRRLHAAEEDPQVRAVVLRLDSPGGSVAPSQEIYEAVKRLDAVKPVVASMGSVAASGAYYVSCGARKVFANPGTLTGSIGVIMEFLNLKDLYQWAKVKRFALTTGKYKGSGAEYRDMTAEEKNLLQTMIDDVLGQFREAVGKGRKMTPAQVVAVSDGRIFSGAQAKKVGLVDVLGTMQDAINEAASLGKISGKPRVFYPDHSKTRLLDFLMDQRSEEDGEEGQSNIEALVDRFLQRWLGVAHVQPRPAGLYWLWNGSS